MKEKIFPRAVQLTALEQFLYCYTSHIPFAFTHPHDEDGGHNHDWDWEKTPPRGTPYAINWDTVAGATLVTACVIGMGIIIVDDATGVGIADDVFLGPLSTGVGQGLILIFG